MIHLFMKKSQPVGLSSSRLLPYMSNKHYTNSAIFISRRFQSNSSIKKKSQEELDITSDSIIDLSASSHPKPYINNDSIYVISIPITSAKSYIYCNHKPSALHQSQLKAMPWLSKVENKLTGLASKGWHKMSTSKMNINIRITKLVKGLLNTVPYEENCAKSFPSINSMIREINSESSHLDNLETSKIVQLEAKNLKIPQNQLNPIPFLHPTFFKPETILNQLYHFTEERYSEHWKYAVISAVFIPLTLPLALIPVVPNVPGLYLTYRLYCHIKALLGVKHLNYLLETEKTRKDTSADSHSVDDTKHLAFQAVPILEEYYKIDNTLENLTLASEKSEQILITPVIINNLCEGLDLHHLKEDLFRALEQEKKKLAKVKESAP